MKRFNRFMAVLMSVVLLASVFILPSSAANGTDVDEKEYVARMYLAHKSRNANLSGHTWIYIENLTQKDIQVGLYTVAPKKGVSLGTYGYAISAGRGLYYNVEAYRYNKANTQDYIYLSKDITQAQLDRVSKKLLRSGVWDYTLNCAFFAFTTWNIVPGPPMLYLIFPLITMIEILIYPSHGTGFEMYNPKMSEVYKQIGFGKNATLVNVDPNT